MKRKYIARLVKEVTVSSHWHSQALDVASYKLSCKPSEVTLTVDLSDATEVNGYYLIKDIVSDMTEIWTEAQHCVGTLSSFEEAEEMANEMEEGE